MSQTSLLAAAAFGAALLAASGTAPLGAVTTHTGQAGSVTVTVRYTGQGTVDDGHRLWIWLFDTPDIGPDSMPIHEAFVSANGGSTTIEGVGPDRVWIAVAFDQRGGSTGNAPPASGSPVGIHAGTDGRPTPVVTGDKATALVTFDDSVRMP